MGGIPYSVHRGVYNMKKIKAKVTGMTCASCEVLIERRLHKVDGIHKVHVSRSKEIATIECDDSIEIGDINLILSEKGYALSPLDNIENPPRPKFVVQNKKRFAEIGAVILVMIGAYFILTTFNLIPEGIGVTDNMSYGFIFVIGLVAATSTCLAVAGGLLLTVAQKYNEARPHLTGRQKFVPHIYFNVGRIVSYVVLGGAIGALGSFLTISSKVTGIITVAASVLMIIMGLQLLQIFPWLNKIQLKMPKRFAHKIYDASHQDKKSSDGKTSSFFFGAATFFLPCGFTQALQLYVLSSGGFVTGALTMLAFSLGTLPSLAGIGALSSFAKGNTQKHFMTFSAVLVIALGLFNMPSGLSLAGVDTSFGTGPAVGDTVPIIDGVQVAEMRVEGLEYYPHKFKVVKDVPVRWVINGEKAVGCGQVITAPKLEMTEFLSADEPAVIEFTPTEIGKIPFSCTMGMTTPGAQFEVVEAPAITAEDDA